MKIKTQLITSTVILAAILVVCSITVIVGNQRLQQISAQEDLARSIQQDTNELGFLTNSYLLFHDQSQLTLWQSKIDSISNDLGALKASNLQQQNLVDDMKSNQQRLISVFTDIKTSINDNPATSQNLDYIGIAYSRLSVQNQGIIANANQLAQLLQNQSDQIKQINSQLIFILFVVFGLLILANFVLINRRVIRGLSILKAGAKVIGSGNLNHVVSIKSKDEFGELSGAFNQMTSDLKTVTASKADLEKEIEERKRIQTELESISAQRQLALNAARMGWWHFDPIKNYSWWDERYKEIFGFAEYKKPNDEILASRIYPEDLHSVRAKVQAALDPVNPQPYTAEYRINLPDGSIKWIEAYGITTFEGTGKDKHATSLVGTVTDISERKKAEEELRESRAKLEAALASMTEAIFIADAEGRFTDFNDEFVRYHRFKNREECSKEIAECPNYIEAFFEDGTPAPADMWAMPRALRGEIGSNIEYMLRRKDTGETWWGSYNFGPIRDKDGKIVGAIVAGREITELKKAEQALKDSEERFRAIAETSLVQISVSRVSDGKILFVNRAYGDAFGYRPEELIGRKGIDLYVNSADRAKLVQSLTEQGFVKDYEVRVKRADGTPFWLSTSVRTVNYAGESAFLGASIDITERKKAEETLRETRDYLDNLFNYANAPIIVWNPDFEITRFNHAFEHLTGRTADEVIGKKLSILFPDDSREKSMDFIRKTPVGERWDVVEIPILHRDGTVRVVLWNSAAVYAPDGKAAVATIAQGQDITERKKAEEELSRTNTELEASNKELEAFSYSVSHDLRAPLRSMEGFSSALLEDYADKLGEQGKQYLKYVQESSDLMGHLIDDLLKLSRVTRSEMNYEMVNLSDLAQKILTELQKTEADRKVKLDISPYITTYGDRNLLRLALENLLGNAWKFSGKTDSPRIEMGVTMHNGKQAYFIRDNGVGFDMTYADKLFKPFQRLHKASEFAGTGIGLATVQRIIRRHGGEVWAESEVGQGATFYFTLG